MKIKLVAFCGAKESGKSTTTTEFSRLLNSMKITTKEVAFAGHLKNVCAKVTNLPIINFLDTKLKEAELDAYVRLSKEIIEQIFEEFDIKEYDYDKHIRPHMGKVFDTPRKLLQYVGTELLHPLDKLIHVNVTLKGLDPETVTLVSDLRFPQEFDALYGRPDFLPIYINNKRAEDAAASDSHASEQGWKQFKDRCVNLDNNGSLGELYENIKNLIQEDFNEY